MADKKMTKREYFEEIITLVNKSGDANTQKYVDFLNHEIELVNNRSNKSGTTAVQKANAAILDIIRTVLAEQESAVTITDLLKDPRLKSYTVEKGGSEIVEEMTNQKLTSMMKKLVDAGEVQKEMVKKKAYFSMPQ